MPLSKKRDKERKQRERAKIRLEKAISSSQEKKPVQPEIVIPAPFYNVDADGNTIYEE